MIEALQLSKELAAVLNGGQFSQEFTAAARALPEYDLAQLKNLTISIVPKSAEIVNLTRAVTSLEIEVDIAVQRKVSKDLDGDVEELLKLVSELVKFVNRKNISDAKFKKIVNEPIYSSEHLNEKRLFTSLITVTYSRILTTNLH